MAPADSLEVVIFSFNRGDHLLNCVHSVRGFAADVKITVFDDGSTDNRTCAILADLHADGTVTVLAAADSTKSSRRGASLNGGLHANMQCFIDRHARCPLALFLQDDTQLVRMLTARDIDDIHEIFDLHPSSAFVYPAFLANRTACTRGFVDFASFKDGDPSFSFRHEYEYSGFFDICIAHVERLRRAGWLFGNELATSLEARQHFGTMRLMRSPFVALLPAPPTFSFRGKTWIQRIWEHFRTGLYPIDPMSKRDIERMLTLRDDYPTADEFLTSTPFPRAHPWPYTKMERAPRLLVALERIEGWIRRSLCK